MLARHGRTEWNAGGRFQGHSDIHLDDVGEAQAAALSARLAEESIDAAYASDLQRAWRTGELIAARHGIAVQRDARLREMNYGLWEGLPWQTIQEKYPDVMRQWRADPQSYCLPEGGESLGQVAARVNAVIDEVRAQHAGETVLVAAHGGTLQVLIGAAMGLPLRARWQFGIQPASLSEVHLYSDRAQLYLLNDMHHLNEITAG